MNNPNQNPEVNQNQNTTQDPQWYDEVISSYDFQSPKTGQVIEGTIIRLDDEGALIDVGVKRDAVVPPRDLAQLDKEILSSLHVGDKVMVYVISPAVGDNDLQVSIHRGLEYKDWLDAEKYLESKETLNLQVIGYNRGGLIVRFQNLRGFLPYSQVPELKSASNPRIAENLKREMVGKDFLVKVIEVSPERNRLIFSALEAQAEKRKARIMALHKGQVIEGKVASLVDFGIFVDLDGVDGLVHISQLDWKKVRHPSELVKVGDPIHVKVTDIDVERERISLSRKATLPSPWETINEIHTAGEYLEVIITRVVDFGAFARLPEGIEGLIHTSQIGYSAAQSQKDALKPGDRVLVKILEVNPERRRMALSMRQVPMEKQIAWAMESEPEEPRPARPAKGSKGKTKPEKKTTPVLDEQSKAPEAAEAAPDSEIPAESEPEAQPGIPEEAEVEEATGIEKQVEIEAEGQSSSLVAVEETSTEIIIKDNPEASLVVHENAIQDQVDFTPEPALDPEISAPANAEETTAPGTDELPED